MELRIFCQRGCCENMLRAEVHLGCGKKDILRIHGWEKKNGLIICRECLMDDRERTDLKQLKSA